MKENKFGCLGVFVILVSFGYVANQFERCSSPNKIEPSFSSTATEKPVNPEETANNVTAQYSWNYYDENDPMSNGIIKYASIQSNNTASFNFPYQGAQHATLTIRKHPRNGNDIILSIEKGQFICNLDGGHLKIRFDDGVAQTFLVYEPSDHSTTTVFIQGYNKFMKQLKYSKTMKIEATFYQEGNTVFNFDTSDFKPL